MTTRYGVKGFVPTVEVVAVPTHQPVVDLVARERETYEAIWTGLERYGEHSPGADAVPRFLEMSGATGGTILDAGCGSGKGALALQAAGFDVTLVDLTPAGLVPEAQALPFAQATLWSDLTAIAYAAHGTDPHDPASPATFEYVYCCDVLEHIPPEFTMLTVARLCAVARAGVFLSISTVPDAFGAWVGKALHQSVFPFVWWRDHLSQFGEIVECRDVLNAGLFYLRPR